MEYLSNVLNYAVSKISQDRTSPRSDKITSFQFFTLRFTQKSKKCLSIGFERGFEVWSLEDARHPSQLLSIRNSGVKSLVFHEEEPDPSLLLLSLYPTLDFPLSSFQVFSMKSCKTMRTVSIEEDIESLNSKGRYIIVSTVSNSIQVFIKYQKTFVVCPAVSSPELYRPVFGLSDKVLAYTLATRPETLNGISASFFNFANNSLEAIIGQTTNGKIGPQFQVCIVELDSQSKLQSFQAFEVPVNFIGFNESGNLMFLSPENGQSFHIYRKEEVFQLVYSLYRGLSLASTVDVSFNPDGSEVTVTSNKGTCHVYSLSASRTLSYRQAAKNRLRLNSLGSHYESSRDFLILTKSGEVLRIQESVISHLFQVTRPIDFKCKVMQEDWP